MTAADHIAAAVAKVRACNLAGSMAIEIVCTAAETLLDLMDSPAQIEWCDHHGRPHEFCAMFELDADTRLKVGDFSGPCVPRVRAVGPEVDLWTT